MISYFIFGALRNLLGMLLLAFLIKLGYSVSIALFITVLFGLTFYMIQINCFVGKVDFFSILKMYVYTYCMNRLMLWVVYEKIGLSIFIAQFFSIIFGAGCSYLYLKAKLKRDSKG